MKRLHLIISGRVQGVGFRAFVHKQAQELALNGWVRNLPDGKVESVAEGPEEKLNHFLNYCKQGPTRSQVTSIAESWEKPENHWNQFTIRL